MPARKVLPTRRNTPSRPFHSTASILARADAFGAVLDGVDAGLSFMESLAQASARYRLSAEEAMDVAAGLSQAYPVLAA